MFRRTRFETDLREELEAHLAEREAEYIRQGLPPQEARRRATLDFGNVTALREASADVWRLRRLDALLRDCRFALRALRRQPAFTLAAVATFALGIGAAAAIFSVAYGVAFRPLAYPHPDRLVRIHESNARTNELKQRVSEGTFQAWREQVPALEDLALYSPPHVSYTAGDAPQPMRVMRVSPSFFGVLGASPLLGRGFRKESEYTPRTTNEYVLSHAAWQRLFGGDMNIVDRPFYIREDDDPIRIVGVMPPGFAFDVPVDAWRPNVIRLPVARVVRSWRYDDVIARLRPGHTIDELRHELDAASARLAADFPATNAGWTTTVETLHESIIGRFGPASWLFLAAVGTVLAAACANVAGLLTARAMGRARETSIRIALGAGRWRLAQLWLAESLLLAAVGAAAGVGLAWWLVRVLRAAAPPGLPRVDDIAIDAPVLAIVALATIGSAVVCALAPVVATRDRRLTEGFGAGSARAGDTRMRRAVSSGLVVLQSAAALALVTLSIVFGRSFLNLTAVDLGWQPDRVIGLEVAPRAPSEMRRPWFWYAQWSERLIARLEANPLIARAAITSELPFSGGVFRAAIARGADPLPNETRWPIGHHIVTEGYFDALGLSRTRGRLFTRDDRFDEPGLTGTIRPSRGVAVISESVARALWPGEDPLGKTLRIPSNDNVPFREVVGVVADVQFQNVGGQPSLDVFVPWLQGPVGRARLIVRTAGDAAALVPTVREAVLAEQPSTGIDRVAVMSSLVARAMAPARMTSQLLAGLGAVALVLAAVGVFGSLSVLVRARARETAVCIALGASPGRTLRGTLGHGLWPVGLGAALGLLAAAAIARSARSLLYGVDGVDPASLAASLAIVLAVTALACLAPAVRAARTDPLGVLRAD